MYGFSLQHHTAGTLPCGFALFSAVQFRLLSNGQCSSCLSFFNGSPPLPASCLVGSGKRSPLQLLWKSGLDAQGSQGQDRNITELRFQITVNIPQDSQKAQRQESHLSFTQRSHLSLSYLGSTTLPFRPCQTHSRLAYLPQRGLSYLG